MRTLEDIYVEWLYDRYAPQMLKDTSYFELFRQLYRKEFVWLIPNDDNRMHDGHELRHDFLEEFRDAPVPREWVASGCSMLEMLVALSHRLAFQGEGASKSWFWKLLSNLELDQCTDERYNEKMDVYVDNILDRVIWRTYNYDGSGGLFPLRHAQDDQRDVEIWYQMSEYLYENY